MAVLIVALYVAVAFHLGGPAVVFGMVLLPVALMVVVLQASGQGSVAVNRESVHTAMLHPDATVAERLYGEILLLLIDTPLPSKSLRPLLRQCNALVETDRHLAAQGQRLRMMTFTQPLPLPEGGQEEDPEVQRSLQESLRLLRERNDILQTLPVTLRRVEAQRETICQALLLAQAVLVQQQAESVLGQMPDWEAFCASVQALRRG
jgi:hypothetical protein